MVVLKTEFALCINYAVRGMAHIRTWEYLEKCYSQDPETILDLVEEVHRNQGWNWWSHSRELWRGWLSNKGGGYSSTSFPVIQ